MNGRLPLEDGSDRIETVGKCISDDMEHFMFRRRFFFSKLRTIAYPPNKARIGVKLWQNAFQTICNFSFFDAEKIFGPKNFQKILEVNFCFQETGVLEELGGFERHWHVRRKKLLPVVRLFLGRVPWRRGKQGGLCF